MRSNHDRAWVHWAIGCLRAEAVRAGETPLHRFPLPPHWGIDLYLKDESQQPTGSLKQRLARALFEHALCNGWIGADTPIVEASSGSTAVSEAYFASLLGLRFTAVLPAATSPAKIALIEFHGGRCHRVDDPSTIYREAERIAAESGGLYLDQFTYGERATGWRGDDTVVAAIFRQMAFERHPVPTWIVTGAGTGATATTIGRYTRDRRQPTRLCVVDPESSAFFESWAHGNPDATADRPSRIEGIGRPRVEPSFLASVVDHMIQVPDAASVAAMRFLHRQTGRAVGGSTGTNVWGALALVAQMHLAGQQGSVVTLICDGGDRYRHTYYDDAWVAEQGLDLERYAKVLHHQQATGQWLDGGW